MEALAFRADHEGGGGRVGSLAVVQRTPLVETINPIANFLELLQRAINIGDADHRHVRQGSGSGAGNGVCQPGGTPFGNHDSGGAGGVGGTNDRPEIMRVLDSIQHDMQPAVRGSLFDRREARGRSISDHALVLGSSSVAIQVFLGLEANRNAALAANFDQFLKPGAGHALRDDHAVERQSGAKRFADGMDS